MGMPSRNSNRATNKTQFHCRVCGVRVAGKVNPERAKQKTCVLHFKPVAADRVE